MRIKNQGNQMSEQIRDCDNKTDEELVLLTVENPEFYFCLMARYEDKLLRYVGRISSVGKETAEDLVQEIFIKAFENINDFDTKLKFSSWIYRIARNHVVSYWRKNKGEAQVFSWDDDDKFKNMFGSGEDLEKEIGTRLIVEKVRTIIGSLKPAYQEVMLLRYLEDKSYEDIGDILKKPVGTVGTLLSEAKKQLREKIKKENIKL